MKPGVLAEALASAPLDGAGARTSLPSALMQRTFGMTESAWSRLLGTRESLWNDRHSFLAVVRITGTDLEDFDWAQPFWQNFKESSEVRCIM
ncbi:hypothetical protein CALVIDRAFT_543027 [Calocera viscosa TUFC12733]|uniref:Uncharacterized protein n=1 Tax=Calocera viscosa (strain TUFC12733) TaxID=1330018 RepID=A0A167G005_CALVF|nr:hypothetical protein CALVIDRAFT_543027 [Calocera viscosa TUFC12733]